MECTNTEANTSKGDVEFVNLLELSLILTKDYFNYNQFTEAQT